MNVLGDEWVEELARHQPDTWPSGPLSAYQSFSTWLWVRIVNAPVEDGYGKLRADGQQLETFRRTLPLFEVFQAWHNREEHQGGLRARVFRRREEQILEDPEKKREWEEYVKTLPPLKAGA